MNDLLSKNKKPEEIKSELEKHLSDSVKNAIEATKIDKNDYQNWLNLGNVYKSLIPVGVGGAIDNALLAYDKALELRPVSPNIYYLKAVLEHSRGENEKAREYVEKAISLRNQYTEAIFLLAQIQVEDKDIENAIDSVKAITLFNPNNAVAYFQLGLLHYASDDFTDAVKDFVVATNINPEYANARYFLGLAYWRLGDLNNSLEQFKKVAKTNPTNKEVLDIVKNLEEGKNPFENLDIKDIEKLPIDDVNDGTLKNESKDFSE
jgi:Tfp pilus assembly protein PilF